MSLLEMVTTHGVGAKLKHAVIAARGWRPADHRTGDEGEWYAQWATLAPDLNDAVAEWVRLGRPRMKRKG